MKKLILIISLILIGFSCVAQTEKGSATTSTLGYATIKLDAADTLKHTADSIAYVFSMNDNKPAKFSVIVGMVSKTAVADTNYHITVYGKVFGASSWTKIGTSGAVSANVASATVNVVAQYDYATAVNYSFVMLVIRKVASKTNAAGMVVKDAQFRYFTQ